MAKREETNNNLQLLKQSLREKKSDRLYIFHGEEIFLLHHYLNQLKKLLIDELTESFNFHKLTVETFNMDTFSDCVENLPMMSEYSMVWVDEIDIFGLDEGQREKLIQTITDIPEYCTVVFTYETTRWKPDKRMKKLWDAVNSNATIVEFEKQSQRDLISWITRHFAANQKSITPDLCAYLIEITDGTMTALAGEIRKICAYSGADAIRKTDIDAVVEPVLDAVVFHMTDQLTGGNYGAALMTVQKLMKMQEEPIAILGAIGANFRKMAAARILHENGKSHGELMRICGMPYESTARRIMSSGSRFSSKFYTKASELILETDRKLKTSYDTPERLLEMLIMELAQEARNDSY